LAEGFAVKMIFPPSRDSNGGSVYKDWNDSLVNSTDAGVIKELIANAYIIKSEIKDNGFTASKEKHGYRFQTKDVIYQVSGVKDMFISNLRVNVKSEISFDPMLKYYDMVNLYSAKSRKNYSRDLSTELNIEQKKIEKDLIKILEYLEEERDRNLFSESDIPKRIELTEEDKELGLKLLKNPKMYDEIIHDMTVLGYTGEENNKLLVWLAGISRLLPKPLSVFIQSPPSTGKSYLLEILLNLLPPESVEWITSVSDQSFNYMDEEDFLDKIFMLGEALHNEVVEGYIRQMQSENKIARKVTVKDPKTGIMRSVTIKHTVRLVFMMTSTAMKVNTENLSRCLLLKADNTKEQTERVLVMQRYKSSYEGYLEEKHVVPQIIRKHIAAQRLLKKIRVLNPFEKYIRFPSTRSVMRRGQNQFLNLIKASCVARQMQKEPVEKIDHYTGEREHIYECDFVDYGTVRRLFIEGGLLQQGDDLSAPVVNLYESIRKLLKKKAERDNLKTDEVSFIQSEVRNATELGHESVKRYLRILVEYEYLQITAGKRHGARFSYRLREDKPIEEIDISSIIPTVEEIKRMMNEDEM